MPDWSKDWTDERWDAWLADRKRVRVARAGDGPPDDEDFAAGFVPVTAGADQ